MVGAFRLFPFAAVALVVCQFAVLGARGEDQTTAWRAGIARTKITPTQSMWMAGYAARTKPSEGTEQELHAKALAVEDASGARLVIVTFDLIGVPRKMRAWLEEQVEQQYQLPPQALLLNASHTHCGPELRADKASIFGLDPARVEQGQQYLQSLQQALLKLVGEALRDLAPANLGYTRGRAGFAMNRRLPVDGGIRNAPFPNGPVDHDVPVLRVEAADGTLRAIVFGYACHNTTLSFYRFCGDYAGYAQEYLEAAHPETMAMFVTGCGADQNPQPRRTLAVCKQHGRSLANGVEAALLGPTRPVAGPLRLAIEAVPVEFADPPGRRELERQRESGDRYTKRRAVALLEQLDAHGSIDTSYPYLIQAVSFGDDLLLLALAGEVVVDYALRFKLELGGSAPVWVAAYSNDVFGYVPSLRVLQEGGYEGGGAMRYTTLPGPFAASVEQRIVAAVHRLADEVRP